MTTALNDALFLLCYDWSSCLVWHVSGRQSQPSVQEELLAVALVEGCFLLCTLSSVTDQCEAFLRGLLAVKLGPIVASPWAACLSSSPLTDQPACFSFPWSGKANWRTFDSLCFPGLRVQKRGPLTSCVYGGMLAGRDGPSLWIGASYEGGWVVCHHSRCCCQGNAINNWHSVYSCQQKQAR